MNHSENLRGMAEFPKEVDREYLLNMADSMLHYEQLIKELETQTQADIQTMLDKDETIGRLEHTIKLQKMTFDDEVAELEADLKTASALTGDAQMRVYDLEKENALLLADKEASPAIIAGYRERGEQLLARVAEIEKELADQVAANIEAVKLIASRNKENALLLAENKRLDKLQRGEFICSRCGIRKDGEKVEADF